MPFIKELLTGLRIFLTGDESHCGGYNLAFFLLRGYTSYYRWQFMRTSSFESLSVEAQKFLQNESSGHDFYHLERVFNNAMYIQKIEGGDFDIIGGAAMVHDICRPWEKKTGNLHFGDEALEIIKGMLEKSNFSPSKISSVLEVVRLHDIYDWTNKALHKSTELQVVQDADNLDAIGAIGIARTFAFGGANSLPMYVPGEKLSFTNDFVEDPKKRTSTIAHFYEKLLKLKDNMNTRTGKRIAEQRHKTMNDFLKRFFDEWEGRFEA